MTSVNLEGCITALITPFKNDENRSVDYESLKRLVQIQIQNHVQGIVVGGTTGESSMLTEDEFKKILETCIDVMKSFPLEKRKPIIAGTGTNCTTATIKKTLLARSLGADAALIVTPYYVRPCQNGLYEHYRVIAEAVKPFPIITYNVPKRTACDLLPETISRLSQISNIIGHKEAHGEIERVLNVCSKVPDSFSILSGDDGITIPCMLQTPRCRGVISVLSNFCPDVIQKVCELAASKEHQTINEVKSHFDRFQECVFKTTNPVGIKAMVSQKLNMPYQVRLPLVTMSQENNEALGKAYKDFYTHWERAMKT